MLTKNQEIEIEITALGSEGEGIGHTEDGITVFVADGLVGDTVLAHITKVKKSYAYAFVAKLIRPSSFRVEAKCPIAKKCGGCSLQHLSYEKQLELKQEKVRNCITRIGGIKNPPMEPIVGADNIYYYRNKAQFPVGTDKDGKPVVGFYRKHSHDVVANTECYIQASEDAAILKAVQDFLQQKNILAYNEETGQGLVRHVFTRVGFATKEIMICLVINGKKLPHQDEFVTTMLQVCKSEGLKLVSVSLNENTKNTNVILGSKMHFIYGQEYIEDKIGDVKYQISPLSFYQVNPEQTKKLYDLALEYAGLTGKEAVWDLYCGIGTISLYMARNAGKVYGVEIIPEAIEDAKKNAKLNGFNNTEFFVGAAEEVLPAFYKNNSGNDMLTPDVIVVDPPRKGCDEACLETMVKMSPARIVYVSCDPATLARDLKYLVANGYELVRVRPVDQFCHTMHVETVCLLSKLREAKNHVSVKLDMEAMKAFQMI